MIVTILTINLPFVGVVFVPLKKGSSGSAEELIQSFGQAAEVAQQIILEKKKKRKKAKQLKGGA